MTGARSRHSAEAAADDARREADRWRERIVEERGVLRRARARGEDANREAEDAAHEAASAFADAESALPSISGMPAPAAPIAKPAGTNPLLPGVPAIPGPMGRTPSDVLRMRLQQSHDERTAALHQRLRDERGNYGDYVSGVANELSLGIVDLGGRKDSKAYRPCRK